jgi:diguanylate cyclase (GGDEF)-like protein
MIDIPTLIGYSAVLCAMIGGLFFLLWFKDGRSPIYFWFCLPFLMGFCGGALLVGSDLLPELWGLRLAACFILLAYAFGWQAVRAFYGRAFLPLYAMVPSLAWLVLSASLFEWTGLFACSASMRAILICGYNALAAHELWRGRDEDLSSRAVLFWMFVVYAVIAGLRAPFTTFLPAPLGAMPTEPWSVILYNLLSVSQALLSSAFLMAMSRERVSLKNYRLAVIDPLTGVNNRRAFDEHAEAWSGQTRRVASSVALLLFDLDWFKSINDRFGHGVGDEVITVAAHVAEKVLRKGDKVFRIGGEEFVCLLPGTNATEAVRVAERLRVTFQSMARNVAELPTNATMSIGVVASPYGTRSLSELLIEADKALYKAKGAGRNQTALASTGRDMWPAAVRREWEAI